MTNTSSFQKFIGLSSLAVGLLLAGAASGAVSVKSLRTEYKTNPLGIDVLKPRLSWVIESDRRGEIQSAYQVLVAGSLDALKADKGDLWDSGKVAGDATVGIEYAGAALKSAQQCFWKVKVWDRDGKESGFSEPACWEMGLLAASDWKASWIDAPFKAPEPAPAPPPAKGKKAKKPPVPLQPVPYMRKAFTADKPIKSARLYASALGLYAVSINGQRVGDAVLAPNWSDYKKRVYYGTYDVTSLLKQGPNAIGAIVGAGWYSGHVGLTPGGVYGKYPALLAQLNIEYADGTSAIVATDNSWKTSLGPIIEADLLQGEAYDATKEIPGWNLPAFDDAKWQPVGVRDEKTPLQAEIGPPVRKLRELAVKAVTEPAPGHVVYDFGQNMVGFVKIKVKGQAGTKLTLKFVEMLNPDGTIYTTNLRGARATDFYTLKGGDDETWEPTFTFHGFRYLEITGYPGQLPKENITGVVIHSDCPPSGQWECSNPILNQLQSNIVWGQRGNYLSVPTDCPQRDERLGWMGDAQVFIRTATFNMDVDAFFTKWLLDVSDAQTKEGAYTDVSPFVAAGSGTAAWADAGVICPWTVYLMYADTRILERQYDSMARFIDYMKSHSKDLLRPAQGYGDWLSIAADTPKDVLATAYFAYSTDLMSRIAAILGKQDDAKKYQQLFNDIKAAFNKAYVAPDGRIKGNTQTDYLMALRFNLLDEKNQQAAVKYLVEDIEAKKDHLSTGFVGVSYLLPTLTRFNQLNVAYRLLNQDTFPSWLFSVKHGATTIWERWDGWTPEKGFQNPGMNSFNHYSLGSCGEWMYDTVAGIGVDPKNPGYKHIVIRPRPGGKLTSAKASLESLRGRIATEWKLDGAALTLNVTIPANTTATVYVPAEQNAKPTEAGKPADSAEGVKFVGYEDGAAVYEVGSGTYAFASTVPQK